jgi:hypothetical protein
MIRCLHEKRAGGNDYLRCDDCGLMWDYRREGPDRGLVIYLRERIAEIRCETAAQVSDARAVIDARQRVREGFQHSEEPSVTPDPWKKLEAHSTREIVMDFAGLRPFTAFAEFGPRKLGHNPSLVKVAEVDAALATERQQHAEERRHWMALSDESREREAALRAELEQVNGYVNLIARGKSPCGHWSAHSMTEDTGYSIPCLQCERNQLQVDITAARQEIETLKQEKPCVWTEDSSGDFWDSACGETWCFTDGGPSDNKARYCHGCGHPIEAVLHIDTFVDEQEKP